MDKTALPDIIICMMHSGAVQPQACEYIAIRQSLSAHVITNKLHFWYPKIYPKFEVTISLSLYDV